MTNCPHKFPARRRESRPRSLPAAALVLATLAVLAGGCGSDQSDFRFQFRDADDEPVADVQVFYVDGADTVPVGRTTTDGNVTVLSKHLDQLPRTFEFAFPESYDQIRKEFDAELCAMVHTAIVGTYRSDPEAGVVQESELGDVPSGWSGPGRLVRLEVASSGGRATRDTLRTVSMEITIPVVTTRGARVEIDGVFQGQADQYGELDVTDCWRRMVGRELETLTSLEIDISKAGHDRWRGAVEIPEDGRPKAVVHELVATAGDAGDAGQPTRPTDPVGTESFARLRVKNKTEVISCGGSGFDPPTLYVNDRSTVVRAPQKDTIGWKIEFDLIVKAGQDYRLAIGCSGPADPQSWNPWDESAGTAGWYLLHVPEDARRMVVTITKDLGPLAPLQPDADATPDDFDQSAMTVRQGYRP